jgi:broad specificity phosphatase PhoE
MPLVSRCRDVVLALLVCVPAAAARPGVKTIVLVRHAESDQTIGGSDPPLSAEGKARAKELLRVLGDTPLGAVYVTRFQRNRQTAEPFVGRDGGPKLFVVDDVAATVAALGAEPWGSTALVIGHSNTLPKLLEALTGKADPTPAPYDAMWVVTLTREGGVSVLRLRYGPSVDSPQR